MCWTTHIHSALYTYLHTIIPMDIDPLPMYITHSASGNVFNSDCCSEGIQFIPNSRKNDTNQHEQHIDNNAKHGKKYSENEVANDTSLYKCRSD